MDVPAIREWFDEYLRVFAASGRGERDDIQVFLRYYGVPFLLTTDDEVLELTTEDEVLSAARQLIDGIRAAEYDRSEMRTSEVVLLNATSAIHTADFSRLRADGSEIERLRATYLITDGPRGRRISALVINLL